MYRCAQDIYKYIMNSINNNNMGKQNDTIVGKRDVVLFIL